LHYHSKDQGGLSHRKSIQLKELFHKLLKLLQGEKLPKNEIKGNKNKKQNQQLRIYFIGKIKLIFTA